MLQGLLGPWFVQLTLLLATCWDQFNGFSIYIFFMFQSFISPHNILKEYIVAEEMLIDYMAPRVRKKRFREFSLGLGFNGPLAKSFKCNKNTNKLMFSKRDMNISPSLLILCVPFLNICINFHLIYIETRKHVNKRSSECLLIYLLQAK